MGRGRVRVCAGGGAGDTACRGCGADTRYRHSPMREGGVGRVLCGAGGLAVGWRVGWRVGGWGVQGRQAAPAAAPLAPSPRPNARCPV